SLPEGVESKIKSLLNTLLKDVFNNKIKAGDIYQKLLKIVGSTLQQATTESSGTSFAQVDWNTPDANMLQRLTRDVWQFSAAKNYQQMQDMTLALLDDDGKLRSFSDFKEEATKTHTKYNSTWLKTEYDHAVGSATMASRWSEFEENAADQPYLKYQTVGDNNVRHEHQLLNGIVRKITDSFWNKYFPPNGWECRCDVVQLSASYATETEALPKVPIDSMFATNLAKTGMIFPKNHPYYDGVTDDVMKRAVASLPDDVAYNNVYTSESGNTVDLHIYHGINETPGNIKTAKFLADNGYDVKLLPVLDKDDNDIRELVY
ncbi:phage head morphogenesis protein, partial [Saccharicrinis fermentans]|uniref:phage head morphogenesis protein n=1 Tax=Saccharicrinis fermentans TaxID=982 RepID=UPI0005C5C4AD